MFLPSLRTGFARRTASLLAGILLLSRLTAQVPLASGTYTQTFDTLSAGLPAGWTVNTGATATTLGTAATLNTAAVTWASTTGQWANLAAADNNGTPFTGAEATAAQAAATDRALGIRQTGAFGDPGAAANFNFSTAGLQVSSISFSAQMLSVQTRSTVWTLQYGLGASPASWVNLATYTDPGSFGTTTVNASGFGTALDNQSNVWLRVVALAASSGAGSRDTFGIDDFTVVTTTGGGPIPPGITTAPAPQVVTEGGTAQFMVAASGTAPLTYQWRKGTTDLVNGGIVSGATTDTLTLTGVALADSGNYNVVVTNLGGNITSADAALTVNPLLVAPAISSQPSPQSVPPGGTASFSVTATGTAPLTYQWYKGAALLADGGHVSGATSATLTLTGVSAADVDSYSVVVSNGVNPAATSNPAALTLSAVVTPAGQVSYAGGSYTQNFNSLPASGTFTLPANGPYAFSDAPVSAAGLGGWSFAKYDGSGTSVLFRVDAGTGTSGSVYSYGSTNAPDRALGTLSSGSTIPRFGLTLVNSTGLTVTELTLSYTGEQWRRGGGVTNVLAFEYGLGAADINNGSFVPAPALDFTAPVTTGGGSALDGNSAASRAAVSATLSGLNWAPGQTLVLRWTDVNDSGSDDGLAIDDLTLSTPVSTADIIPTVAFVTPAADTVNVPVATPVSVTFNESVNLTDSWFTLDGSVSGAHPAAVSGGPVSFTLTPTTPFAEGETVTFSVLAAQVTDQATGTRQPAADFSSSFITFSSAPLPIHTIQGAGLASPYAGYPVTVQGVVVASFQAPGQIGGYYLEEPDALHDANPATSEGIYVFDNVNSVSVGDLVTVTGTVKEYGTAPMSETEIADLSAFTLVSSGNPLPTATPVTLPFPTASHAERYEGMRITLPQTLTVTDNYDYGHFGEVILSVGRLSNPTNVVAPGAPAQALAAQNLRSQILLDDGLSTSYPDPTPFLSSADPATATRRAGSTTTGVTGILDNRFGTYVIEPTATPAFVEANPREPAPAVGGRLHIAIGNVLNFFNGDGSGGGFPTSRGATNYAEYLRQRDKIIAGITALAPDIMGLTEIENDGFGPLSALADLVNGLNAAAPAGTTYAYVDGSAVEITTDVIHCGFIYRTETVTPVGAPAMLSHPAFNNLARNPLAQTFQENATGEKLTVCVNHFRAKGSVASGAGNADSGDGQGNNNALRVQQANALTAWLATDPTGSGDADFLIIGDLNAYAKEDPIAAIESASYANLTELFEGTGGYSYSFNGEFGHLDHALANAALTTQVVGAATWHVNADEPIYYDYNTENKSAAQLAINAGTAYRYSDHDPVVVGIDLVSPPVIAAPLVPQAVVVGDTVTFQITASGTPAPTYQWRRNGLDIPGATGAAFVITGVTTANAGSYDVVVTNSAGTVTSNAVVLSVAPAVGSITLTNLVHAYDGSPHGATATTLPAGLNVTYTYNGGSALPVLPGLYSVVGTINSPDYTGSATDTLAITISALVRHAPTLNGGLDGSVQVLLPESITLNGNAWVSGDLLVPGSPSVKLNGKPTYGGTLDGTGAVTPSNYTVTLNGGAVLRHLVRRTDALSLPVVTAPPVPTGTRNVSLNSAGQSPGDFATIRNLTLNGNYGALAVPAGTYGTLTANGSSRFILGVAGATQPVVYNLQGLTLNGNTRLEVVGPVILNLANGGSVNSSMGAPDHPEWLQLNIASGGLTLNGNVTVDALITAPNGTITINGNSTLNGTIESDRLTINGNGMLVDPAL
jgi:predicted extracellular nuclease